jgi:hypothetical protein
MLGLQPLWRESEIPNLAHAAYEEDLALLERTLDKGADPNARQTVFIDGRTFTVTPIEAAIIGRNLHTVQWPHPQGRTRRGRRRVAAAVPGRRSRRV